MKGSKKKGEAKVKRINTKPKTEEENMKDFLETLGYFLCAHNVEQIEYYLDRKEENIRVITYSSTNLSENTYAERLYKNGECVWFKTSTIPSDLQFQKKS